MPPWTFYVKLKGDLIDLSTLLVLFPCSQTSLYPYPCSLYRIRSKLCRPELTLSEVLDLFVPCGEGPCQISAAPVADETRSLSMLCSFMLHLLLHLCFNCMLIKLLVKVFFGRHCVTIDFTSENCVFKCAKDYIFVLINC